MLALPYMTAFNRLLITILFASLISCKRQRPPVLFNSLKSLETDEVSGVIASRRHKGVLFVHNDSGDKSRFFAIDTLGKLLSTLDFDGDPDESWLSGGVRDCEDIAAGPGPQPGVPYIYLGDIGDNASKRLEITIFRFKEPSVLRAEMHIGQEFVHLRYPDGPHDAETLLVDPLKRLMYVVTKRDDDVGLYCAPIAFAPGATITMKKVGKLHLNDESYFRWVTAGDISQDGKQVVIRTYHTVYYWQRGEQESVEQALTRKPVQLPCAPERQGEAIGFNREGTGLYGISEGVYAPVNFCPIDRRAYPLKN